MIVAGQVHVDESMDRFREGHSIRISVQGTPANLPEIAAVPGITRVHSVRVADGESTFRLETDGSAGVLRKVGLAAKGAGLVVTELTREVRDLEDIFQKLRREGQAA